MLREEETWVLQAGASSGVTLGSTWELHDGPTEGSQAIGKLRAKAPQMSSTALEEIDDGTVSPGNVTEEGRLFARQIRIGAGHELKVYFSPEARSLIPSGDGEHKANSAKNTNEIGYVVQESESSAELTVRLRGQDAVFALYRPLVQVFDDATLESRCPADFDAVQRHLGTIARWKWHLNRTNAETEATPEVSMEFMKLGEYHGDKFKAEKAPLENLNKMGVIDFQARPQDEYGIKLINNSEMPLYARVFYFGVLDFSICKLEFVHNLW